MRAYHMPSLPEIPMDYSNIEQNNVLGDVKQMKLKILYSLGDNTNFLARSSKFCKVKTARIPMPSQETIITLGVVLLRDAIDPLITSSPELFNDNSWDYSVYVKDVSEEDEPFVGHGLVSKILSNDLKSLDDDIFIPGRVCSNFAALLSSSKGTSETLEIRLRLVRVKKQQPVINQQQSQQQSLNQQQQQQHQHQQQQPSNEQNQQKYSNHHIPIQPKQKSKPQLQQAQFYRRSSTSQQQSSQSIRAQLELNSLKRKGDNSTDTEDEADDTVDDFIQPKTINTSNMPKMNRFINNNPAPKAARTQSLPVFENMMKPPVPPTAFVGRPVQHFPLQSIAHRIYMADKINERNVNKYSNSIDNNGINASDDKSSPVEYSNHLDVSKRFAPNFMKIGNNSNQTNNNNNPNSTVKKIDNNRKKSRKVAKTINPSIKPIPEDHQVYQSCFNCKTLEAKSWKWNESEDLSKRGLLCSSCYLYMKDKPNMAKLKKNPTKSTNRSVKKQNFTSASSSSSSPAPTQPSSDTPTELHNKASNLVPYYNSSDPLNGFDDMMGSDLDFQFGPMTDIDPLPQHQQLQQQLHHQHQQQQLSTEDKENIPPPSIMTTSYSNEEQPISIKKASRQTSFEKMLVKSFSGSLPTNNGVSPSEWMADLFVDVEPTPKDQTPKDSPKDITTCNTLPCNEESPDSEDSKQDCLTIPNQNVQTGCTPTTSTPNISTSITATRARSGSISTSLQAASTSTSNRSPQLLQPQLKTMKHPTISSSTMPSSPFLASIPEQTNDGNDNVLIDTSSPSNGNNSHNNQFDWGLSSDNTKLSSQNDEILTKPMNRDVMTHDNDLQV